MSEDIVINEGTLLESLNNKADRDVNNINTIAKETIANLSAPSSRYIEISVTTGDTLYTAPANGYVGMKTTAGSSGGAITISNYNNPNIGNGNTRNGSAIIFCCIPVAKGDIVKLNIYNCTNYSARFIYANGN